MSKYMYLYNGPATPPEQMTEAKRNAAMAEWEVWMKSIGSAMVEMGNPMAPGAAVVDDGSEGTASLMNGYSIIEATNMEEAESFARNHPFLSDKSGKFKIEIFELIPM